MTDAFQRLREALAAQVVTIGNSFDPPQSRLLDALAQRRAGPNDLAVLVRHVLRREQELSGGPPPTLLVPQSSTWPDRGAWEAFGVNVLAVRPSAFLVQARPWRPDWLRIGQGGQDPEGPLLVEEERREYGRHARGDPFLDGTPWPDYRSAAQRQAVRAILTAPPGSTLVVGLPTGAGKSLCLHLPSVLSERSLTVVVVPTTALALDQERSIRSVIGHDTAYHGGTGPRVLERNAAIRQRIRRGEQRLLFTSPESLLRSLAGPLYGCARVGLLGTLAIDEAHIVDQWGDDFRPEFQEIAGLRRDLLRVVPTDPFRTLLVTATLTEGCLDTLETLFGQPGPFGVLAAAQLRPEPSYWSAHCGDEAQRRDRVFEALRHLPRPLLLYVTRVADAERWAADLRAAGFLRTAVVTGRTGAEERSDVLQRWQRQEIDVVVANSAFGLGMDKADVRAVVHACVPETLDRFYQEVGRGGRDGRACLSLVLWTDEDVRVARDLNSKTVISVEKGYARWRAMFFANNREVLPDGRLRVPIDVVPQYREGETDSDSDYNRAWNVRTLTLLDRCGVVELDAQPPPERDGGEDVEAAEEAYQRDLDRHRNQRVLKVGDRFDHLNYDATWLSVVEAARRRTAGQSERGLRLMLDALSEEIGRNRCLAELFEEAYRIEARDQPPRRGVSVSRSCGGCSRCRAAGNAPFAGGLPEPRPPWPRPHASVAEDFRDGLLLGGGAFAVFDPLPVARSPLDRQRRERFFKWLVVKGVRLVVAPEETLESLRPLLQRVPGAFCFFAERWEPLLLPNVPTLFYLGSVVPESVVTALEAVQRDCPKVLWAAGDALDPRKPHCRLRDMLRCPSYSLEELLARTGL